MRTLLTFLLAALLAPFAHADTGAELVAAARSQIGVTLKYDARYRRIAYPNGDVPIEAGLSSDVVIRAYRKLGVDLQRLVFEDMSQAWNAYPHGRRQKGPDRNFDHRRVANLAKYFQRHGTVLPRTREKRDYLPGDIVTFRLPGNMPHMAIVADSKSQTGVPLVIHNLRAGAREDNALFSFPITGHYRFTP